MQIGLDTKFPDTVKSIYRAKGFSGFYAGYYSLILREIPFSAIQLPVYELMKMLQKKRNKEHGLTDELSATQNAFDGFVAGFVASLLTTPVDVIKTKLMVNRESTSNTISETFRSILKEEGFKGFFRAWHIRAISIASVSIIFFSGYEHFRSFWLNQYDA